MSSVFRDFSDKLTYADVLIWLFPEQLTASETCTFKLMFHDVSANPIPTQEQLPAFAQQHS